MFSIKWFDKRIALSSKGQMFALAFAFAVLIAVGALVGSFVLNAKDSGNAKFGRTATWGLMQCVDGGFVDATITSNTKVDGDVITQEAPLYVIFLSLGFWVLGAILMSFFTGAVTDFLNSRRDRIMSGTIDYAFRKNHILIVGFDFQVKNLIKGLFARHRDVPVVLLTDGDVAAIYDEILPEIDDASALNLFVMKKDIAIADSYERISLTKALEIYLIGDDGAVGRDGKVLRALDEIVRRSKDEKDTEGHSPIRLYLHIEDSVLYSQVRAMKLPGDGEGLFDLDVYNYYESWAWQCWSARKDESSPEDDYLPLRHRKGTDRAELFVIGAGRMGRAMVNYAMTLMNYGVEGKRSRITIFDADRLKKGFLPDKETIDSMPEVEVVFSTHDGMSDEANSIMLEASQRADTSVTVVIALSNPSVASRAYTELSNRLRRSDISVLVWQSIHSNDCVDRRFLHLGGDGSTAEQAKLRYFGMTDCLPWQNSERFSFGRAVNYYYWKFYDDSSNPHPPAANMEVSDEAFPAAARSAWDPKKASAIWHDTPRWKKWSSVNCGDSFKEKAFMFADSRYSDVAGVALKAEHNRWWSERLLTGWLVDTSIQRQDKIRMLHPDMIPFEKLTNATRDKDKIIFAAMVACDALPS